jgi:hypothetical protein
MNIQHADIKLTGVLVVYEPISREYAEKVFKKFIASIGISYRILIVNNGPDLKINDILGTNDNSEFSGWDEGLNSIVNDGSQVYILANDTFCIRNTWGPFKRRKFRRAVIKASHIGKKMAAGEITCIKNPFMVNGLLSKMWIRTHIFVLSSSALHGLGKISLDKTTLSNIATLGSEEQLIWGLGISENLKARISNWLYPAENSFGWYKSRLVSNQIKLKKAHAIINEKWLAAKLNSINCEFIDCGNGHLTKFVMNAYSSFRQRILKI